MEGGPPGTGSQKLNTDRLIIITMRIVNILCISSEKSYHRSIYIDLVVKVFEENPEILILQVGLGQIKDVQRMTKTGW